MKTIDFEVIFLIAIAAAFLVNIIVQLTKGYIPIPTKLWCILVAVAVMVALLFVGSALNYVKFDICSILISVFASFIIAYIAMYGFDTFKELWLRFKAGENINDDN